MMKIKYFAIAMAVSLAACSPDKQVTKIPENYTPFMTEFIADLQSDETSKHIAKSIIENSSQGHLDYFELIYPTLCNRLSRRPARLTYEEHRKSIKTKFASNMGAETLTYDEELMLTESLLVATEKLGCERDS